MFYKKVLALLMVILMSVSCGVIVNAQSLARSESDEGTRGLELSSNGGVGITPLWSYTANTITILDISNTGVATGTASITGYSGITTKVMITMTLQKKGGFLNLFWNDVATWSQTFYNYKGVLSKSHNVSDGTYRIRAVYVAYKGADSETITENSSNVKY